jgi:protein-S-isoprenylcysteine O-methyltransferase Ste14
MSVAQVLVLLRVLWALFGVYWLAVARGSRISHSAESRLSRPLRWGILLITFTLVFSERTAIGVLGSALVPPNPFVAYAGLALTFSGLALASWARVRLGRFWSDKIVLKVDHQLVCDGPYAYVRHPIYSGVLLAIGGTALVVNQWRAVMAFALLLTNYWIKARREDRLLGDRFGQQFRDHARKTGFLVPHFHKSI